MFYRIATFGILVTFLMAGAAAQTNVTDGNNGTTNSVPVYTGSATLGNSPISVSGNNVGIGTTNPTDELQLLGGNLGVEDTGCGTVRMIDFEASDDSLRSYIQAHSSCDPGTDYLQLGSLYGAVQIVTGATSTPTPRLTVLGSGNVGVGTTNPTELFQVAGGNMDIQDTTCGTVRALNFEAIDPQNDDVRNYIHAFSTCSPATDFLQLGSLYGAVQIVTGATSTPTPRVTVLGNGTVGIGTTTPGAALEVNGGVKLTANSSGSITFQDGTVQSTAFTGGVTGGITGGGTTSTVPVFTGSSAVGNSPISISGSNVGIDTTSPAAALDIQDGHSVLRVGPQMGGDSGATIAFGRFDGWTPASIVESYPGAYGGDLLFQLHPNDNNLGTAPVTQVVFKGSGNVGIGTTSPGAKLEINGGVKLTANSGASITFQDGTVQSTAYTGVTCGGDYAESVDVTGERKKYEPGDVLVIDPEVPGKFLKSAEAYSTSVTGIYSTRPGTVGRRQMTPKSPDEVPMAMMGIVPTKVTAENGPIHPGDLLVTSSTPGYAMKGTDHNRMLGAVIGKALGNLDSGTGVVEVVVTLQ